MSNKIYLVAAGVSVLLGFAALFFITSGLYDSLGKFEVFFILFGVLLITMSLLFARKAYVDQQLAFRVRLLILFGPVISGGSAGLSGIFIGIVPEGLWWVPLLPALLSFVSFQVAFILAILLARENQRSSHEANPDE